VRTKDGKILNVSTTELQSLFNSNQISDTELEKLEGKYGEETIKKWVEKSNNKTKKRRMIDRNN